MNRFLYFFPGCPGVSVEMLTERGIMSRLTLPGGATREYFTTHWDEGPNGAGATIALGGGAEYAPGRQTWCEFERFWVGFENDAAPGPEDLERVIGLQGHVLKLGDGNVWRVPMVMRWDAARGHVLALPHSMRPLQRRIQTCVVARYEPLATLGESIRAGFVDGLQWPIDAVFSACAALLAENYHVGFEEVGILGLLNEEIGLKVLSLAIDTPGLEEYASKMIDQGVFVRTPKDEVPLQTPVNADGPEEGLE